LVAWAPIPEESAWPSTEAVQAFQDDIDRVSPPLSTAECELVLSILDRPYEDSAYGLLNLVVTLLESAPSTGWEMDLPTEDRPWFSYLKSRWINYLIR